MPKIVPSGPGLEPAAYPFSKVVEADGSRLRRRAGR